MITTRGQARAARMALLPSWRLYQLLGTRAGQKEYRRRLRAQEQAILGEARHWKKGWATSYPAVGIQAVRKSKWRAVS